MVQQKGNSPDWIGSLDVAGWEQTDGTITLKFGQYVKFVKQAKKDKSLETSKE